MLQHTKSNTNDKLVKSITDLYVCGACVHVCTNKPPLQMRMLHILR